MVRNDRSLGKYILFTLLTCGIYGIIFMVDYIRDVNIVCNGDGEETPGYLKLVLLTLVTCGIYSFFFYYNLGNRLQRNGQRYGMMITENGSTLLLWMILGSCIAVGPFIAWNIMITNLNALANAYNSGARM